VNRTPPLSTSNRYAPLHVDLVEENSTLPSEPTDGTTIVADVQSTSPAPSHPVYPPRLKRWERRLPRRYVVASTPSENSLHLKVEIVTTDTQQLISFMALLDCGATGLFVDRGFVDRNRITTRTLSRPIPVYNIDGTLNEAGSIQEVVDVVLRYRDHSERVQFAVTGLGKQDAILGYTWLKEHNPEVDWVTKEVKMLRCPGRCSTCRKEIKQERHQRQTEARHLRACRARPMPTVEDVSEDIPELYPDTEDDSGDEEDDTDHAEAPDEIEEGDRVFMTTVYDREEFVRASSTTSQRLSEAFAKNSGPPKSFRESVPKAFHDFEDVFSKESFDELPDRKPWDHAIELELGAKTSSTKVYPLSPNEQEQLDAFIEENLASGRIRPSKSPMAAPVFVIKKKDGSLCLVQDYRALNSKTIKNVYPLPLISDLINRLRGARYFTKLDVRWGYNNVRIKEGDEWKAAFRTNRGLFEPLVMFFGLTNSPATFQTMMNDIFQDLISKGVVCVYLDDILIFTETMEEHDRVTHLVLERL